MTSRPVHNTIHVLLVGIMLPILWFIHVERQFTSTRRYKPLQTDHIINDHLCQHLTWIRSVEVVSQWSTTCDQRLLRQRSDDWRLSSSSSATTTGSDRRPANELITSSYDITSRPRRLSCSHTGAAPTATVACAVLLLAIPLHVSHNRDNSLLKLTWRRGWSQNVSDGVGTRFSCELQAEQFS